MKPDFVDIYLENHNAIKVYVSTPFLLKAAVRKIAIHSSKQRKAIDLNKKNIEAYEHLIKTYNNIKDYEQALYYSKTAIKELPNTHRLFMHKGICFYYLEKYNEAIDSYLEAIEIDSSQYLYYQSIAAIYTKRQKPKEAFNYIDIAIDKVVSKTISMKNKLFLYEFRIKIAKILKKYNILIKDFSKLIELEPFIPNKNHVLWAWSE